MTKPTGKMLERGRNRELVQGNYTTSLKFSLRREEWEAIRQVGRRWFGKDGRQYSNTIPRMLEDFFMSLHSPPAKGSISHTVGLREIDKQRLVALSQMLGVSKSDALRALLYSYDEAPTSLFIPPEAIPYRTNTNPKPPKELGEFLSGSNISEKEWQEILETAKFESYLERRKLKPK